MRKLMTEPPFLTAHLHPPQGGINGGSIVNIRLQTDVGKDFLPPEEHPFLRVRLDYRKPLPKKSSLGIGRVHVPAFVKNDRMHFRVPPFRIVSGFHPSATGAAENVLQVYVSVSVHRTEF